MVAQHYRWDFIGLSTDQKPTPATSEKVVDGSTFYCSDNSKLYVYCKDQWYEKTATGGGGTTYTAGDGITITEDEISVDPTYVATMEELDARINKGAGAPTTATEGVVGGLYEDTTNGKLYICTAVTEGTDPDPDTYTWEEVGGGGGGDAVYSDKTTSNATTGGAVYIGDKDASQNVISDPTTTDNHYRYFWALPYSGSFDASTAIPANEGINIGGVQGESAGANAGTYNINIGYRSQIGNWQDLNTAIGWQSKITNSYCVALGANAQARANYSTAIGYDAQCWQNNSIALGKGAYPTRQGELNITCDNATAFNNTIYRVIGGVHDGQKLHDAATVAQGNTLATSAPTTSTEGVLGQLYTDTTNMHTYQCTAISGSTYTWTQRW